jgi:hypothetical protein
MTNAPDHQRDLRPGNQKPTALAALLAAADVVLAILAGKFFDSAAWVGAVIVQTLGPDRAHRPLGEGVGPRIQLHRMRRIGSDVSG